MEKRWFLFTLNMRRDYNFKKFVTLFVQSLPLSLHHGWIFNDIIKSYRNTSFQFCSRNFVWIFHARFNRRFVDLPLLVLCLHVTAKSIVSSGIVVVVDPECRLLLYIFRKSFFRPLTNNRFTKAKLVKSRSCCACSNHNFRSLATSMSSPSSLKNLHLVFYVICDHISANYFSHKKQKWIT